LVFLLIQFFHKQISGCLYFLENSHASSRFDSCKFQTTSVIQPSEQKQCLREYKRQKQSSSPKVATSSPVTEAVTLSPIKESFPSHSQANLMEISGLSSCDVSAILSVCEMNDINKSLEGGLEDFVQVFTHGETAETFPVTAAENSSSATRSGKHNLTESSSSSEPIIPMSVSQIAAETGGEGSLAGLVTEKAVEFLEMSSKMTTNISSTNIQTETQISSVNEPPGRVKKKTPNGMAKSNTWFRNRNKLQRLQGEAYCSSIRNEQGEFLEQSQRLMGPRCDSKRCRQVRSCHLVSEEYRQRIFTSFWSSMDWDQRNIYVVSLADMVDVIRKRV